MEPTRGGTLCRRLRTTRTVANVPQAAVTAEAAMVMARPPMALAADAEDPGIVATATGVGSGRGEREGRRSAIRVGLQFLRSASSVMRGIVVARADCAAIRAPSAQSDARLWSPSADPRGRCLLTPGDLPTDPEQPRPYASSRNRQKWPLNPTILATPSPGTTYQKVCKVDGGWPDPLPAAVTPLPRAGSSCRGRGPRRGARGLFVAGLAVMVVAHLLRRSS